MTMRNRKSAIVAFMLVVCMLLAVGYAALSDDLYINGSAAIDADDSQEVFQEDVYFIKALSGSLCTAEVDATDNDKGTITVNVGALKGYGDEVAATFTIKNDSDLAVTIAKPTIGNGITLNGGTDPEIGKYFDVYVDWSQDRTIPAGGTLDVPVTIKVIKTPDADQSLEFEIKLVANSVSN